MRDKFKCRSVSYLYKNLYTEVQVLVKFFLESDYKTLSMELSRDIQIHNDFIFLDRRSAQIPHFVLQWTQSGEKTMKSKNLTIEDFGFYYLEKVKRVVENRSYALVNKNNSDINLSLLANFKLKIIDYDPR